VCERESVYVRESGFVVDRERKSVCVCVCVRQREGVCERECVCG
jgi:hypothetical protein